MDKKIVFNIVAVVALVLFVFNAGQWGLCVFVAICLYAVVRLAVSIVNSYRRYKGVGNGKYTTAGNGSRREYVVKLTAKLMGLFLITGSLLFVYTFRSIGDEFNVDFNNTELIVRSIMCSLDMFMLGVDSNILDRLDNNALLKSALMIQATLSFLCTMVLLISLVYSRFMAYYMLHRRTKITDSNNHLYIFFGINDNSKLLATDIHAHDEKALTIFVDTAEMEESDSSSWDNIISMFTHRQKTFDFAKETDSLVTIASKQLCDLEVEPTKLNPDIFALLGIEKVRDLIKSLETTPFGAQLQIFFLSDNEDANIRGLLNLAKDSTILSLAEKTIQTLAENKEEGGLKDRPPLVTHKVYCHARNNGPNKVLEDLAVLKGLDVEMVDSSHLAVEVLKSNGENHPVRVAHLSKEVPTTVTAPLNSLIVGFGEVGRDTFRYLYEFATFIRFQEGMAKECKPKITAIDSKMDDIKGLFEANTPGINYEDGSIRLLQMNYSEVDFFKECLSPKNCKELNYIVIALGDDDRNIFLATVIFNRIRQYRADLSDLIIMVRCVRDEMREKMQKIANHYNRGTGEEDSQTIRLFGNPAEIYTYDIIIKDELAKQGRLFLDNYRELAKEKPDSKADPDWFGRRLKLTGADQREPGKPIYSDLDKLRKLRRQENQDLSNALHANTKIWLMQKALGQASLDESLKERIFDENGRSKRVGRGVNIDYPELTAEEKRVMLGLAMLEHARWNSAHALLGYERNTEQAKCDERHLLHNCLTEWENLDEESVKSSTADWTCDYKSYDFCVVDCSLAIFFKDDTVGRGEGAPRR